MSYNVSGLGAGGSSSSAMVEKSTRTLQILLAKKGFDPGPIDNKWGTRTSSALNRAAAAAGLSTDGTAGSGSSVRLYSAVWMAVSALPTNPVTPGRSTGGRRSPAEVVEDAAITPPSTSTTKSWLPWALGGTALLGVGAFFYAKGPKRVAANRRRRGR